MRTRRRKISTAALAIKLALRIPTTSILCASLLAGLGGGCVTPSVMAPFPARPDTVLPGDLRGPFDGRVLDAESGKPVEGAAVSAGWAYEQGRGLAGPAAAASRVVETDADGRYRIARESGPDDPRLRVARFTLIIYKRGYVAYRSDRRFSDLSPRHDFAQGGNQVKIEKLPAEISHARHLAFVGAGGPLLSRLAWELPLAAAETEPVSSPQNGEGQAEAAPDQDGHEGHEAPLLDARGLLSADELKAVTAFNGDFTVEALGDLPSTPSYDSVHFVARGRAERDDAAFRVFKLPPAEAEKQYEVMLKELAGAKETKDVGDRSLRATEGEVLAIGMLNRAEGVVLLFTCGKGLCGDHSTVVGMVKRMVPRMARLGHAPLPSPTTNEPQKEAPGPATPTPAESEPDPQSDRLQLQPPEMRPGRMVPMPGAGSP